MDAHMCVLFYYVISSNADVTTAQPFVLVYRLFSGDHGVIYITWAIIRNKDEGFEFSFDCAINSSTC